MPTAFWDWVANVRRFAEMCNKLAFWKITATGVMLCRYCSSPADQRGLGPAATALPQVPVLLLLAKD